MIDYGLNLKNSSLLIKAVHENFPPQIIKKMLDAGADVNALDGDGYSPLLGARNVEVVQLLLDKGADVQATDKIGNTPLHIAAFLKDPYITKLLVSRGADIHAKTKLGATPVMVAQALGNKKVFKYLSSLK